MITILNKIKNITDDEICLLIILGVFIVGFMLVAIFNPGDSIYVK